MSKDHFQKYEEVTVHKFKTHIARYIRMLEAGLYKAVIVKRGVTPVGLFMLYPPDKTGRDDKNNKND